MTVKSLRRQLMAAIAMVVVSAVALSSSTYAWFASNNKVTATGMQVQATAEGGIEIAYVDNGTAGDYATTATAGMNTAGILYPTSTIAKANGGVISSDWYHASASVASAYQAKEGTYEILTLQDGLHSDTGKNYYVKKEFNIRSVSASKKAQDLKVSGITITGASNVLDKSLRVAVVCGNSAALYAPCYGVGSSDSVSYKVAISVDSNGNATMPNENNVTAYYRDQTSSAIKSGEINNGDGEKVTIYIWYEGEDSNHFSDNLATNISTISLSVDFEATIE